MNELPKAEEETPWVLLLFQFAQKECSKWYINQNPFKHSLQTQVVTVKQSSN